MKISEGSIRPVTEQEKKSPLVWRRQHQHVHEHGKDHLPADKLGMLLSFLCLVHCILGPILIVALPGLGWLFGSELTHLILLLLVIPVAYFSFFKTYRSHGFKSPILWGSLGISFLALALWVPEQALEFSEPLSFFELESLFSVTGASFLAYAHYRNFRQCQCRD